MRQKSSFGNVLGASIALLAAFLAVPLGIGTGSSKAFAQGTEIGFPEDFALAADRTAALEQLIPGTEEYYFRWCLHHQNTGAFEKVPPLLATWIERYGRTSGVIEIENRQALLTFERDPRATFAFLRDRLGLRFDHQREVRDGAPDLPVRLDPARISRATLMREAFDRHPGTVDGFRPSAFDFLAAQDLDADRLHRFLQLVRLPDLPNLPALVIRDLDHKASKGFGSLPIHGSLLLDQLEACVTLRPALLDDPRFVTTYMRRLAPDADTDWKHDASAREAYLDRLQGFTQRLTPAHNSLKAQVLYHRLAHDLALGTPDRDRFLAYLRLPRPATYVNPRYLERRSGREEVVRFDVDFPTLFPPIGDDEPLVRAYFEHLFRSEDSWQPYAELVREDWLKRVFAETKILNGIGDMERWYSLLDDPGYYEQLKERVEILFPPTRKVHFRADEPVEIEVDLKNVGTLLVKVFEIDAFNYYRETGREIDASLELDGLVANEETTHTYDTNPMRRHRERFAFPSLTKPGAYVVDFIGNGLSSRVVIQKGRLRALERQGAAGHVFRVVDEANRAVPDATLWLAGREFLPDETGRIVVPYSTAPGRETIVLRRGRLASLDTFKHQAEVYSLHAAIHVDQETLLAGGMAKILVRPTLQVNGYAASLALLEDPVLVVVSRDQDDVESTLEVRGFELHEDRESIREIRVPENLASLSLSLRGKVRNLSRNETVDLVSATRTFPISGIEQTDWTDLLLLGRTDEGWVLDRLGKNGEAIPDRPVTLALEHRDFTDPVHVTLKTDAAGRIHLGALEGITSIRATGTPLEGQPWILEPPAPSPPRFLDAQAGETVRVAIPPGTDGPAPARRADRADVAFFETRPLVYYKDRIDLVSVEPGFFVLRDLPPGDYELHLKATGAVIDVRVARGESRDGWVLGASRHLERREDAPLQITGLRGDGDALEVRLANADENARVHVIATRYHPAHHPFTDLLAPTEWSAQAIELTTLEASYNSGRDIGDEYRYILERRYARRFPGNMLRRPGLLLNPWSIEETPTMIGLGGGAGGAYGGRRGGKPGMRARGAPATPPEPVQPPGLWANLNFLPAPAVLLANLRPGADGILRVPLADLGPGQEVHVVAVDPESTAYRSIALPQKPLEPRDLRLARGLDPERHFTEQRRIELVHAGTTTVIEDVATSKTEAYDSLERVYRLYRTLGGGEDLREFEFALRWPSLSPEEKRALYTRHACHELHFFLWQKDRPFFDEVIRPYLANKMHKTFLDEWLLGMDLARYLDPWAYARLNLVERILLGRRIEGERDAAQRHVRDLFELVPPDIAREAQLFRTVLLGSALEADAGLSGVLRQAQEGAAHAGEELRRLENLGYLADAPARGDRADRGVEAEGKENLEIEEELLEPEDAELADRDEVMKNAEEPQAEQSFAKKLRSEDKSADLKARVEAGGFWSRPDRTREYIESNWWHRRPSESGGGMIPVNAFWADWAEARGNEPFFSTHFAEASSSFAEMMLALAVLDLPFQAEEHETRSDGAALEIRAATPILLVRKEILPAEPTSDPAPILVSQNFFRHDDRFRWEGNERYDKFVTDEFLTGVVYGCQIVVTNPSSSPRNLELLLQIPRGSIPVQRGFRTRGVDLRLEPFSTATVEYRFTFPAAGDFAHYPVHVASDGRLLAFAEPATLHVVAEPSQVDTTSWEHVSQNAEPAEVLAYLRDHNLGRVDLRKIAWRMRDRGFFEEVLGLLRRRHVYADALWSYAILHGDVPAAREFLRTQNRFLATCGRAIDSPLVTIDPVERRAWQLVEYEPLFNPRAHRFGKRWTILNESLARQYLSFLEILGYRPKLDDDDWMTVTYYLLLQDRVEEALDAFAKVDPGRLAMRLQYDYFRAYLDFFSDVPAVAREIAQAYRDYPVERWRARFLDVLHQLDEVEGKAAPASDPDDRTQRQTRLAAAEPVLELEVEARKVRIRYRNLEACEVAWYPMDVEFLFSSNPFVKQEGGAFAFVRPNRVDRVVLPTDRNEISLDLPEALRNANLLVEVRAGGKAARQAYFASSLAVELMENYGQLRVTHAETGRPLSKVYVKVYAREAGGDRVRFHKDGYTDLRGRFDYASLSGEESGSAERYAILVLSETDGAAVREAAPPKE